MNQLKSKLELLDQSLEAKRSVGTVMTRGTCRGLVKVGQNAACGSLKAYVSPVGTWASAHTAADDRRVQTDGLCGRKKQV